jgi:endogenous inhibitor of DNA gyrase (YacG/DUF329 family)
MQRQVERHRRADRPLPRLRRRQRLRPSNPYRPFCSARCKGIDLGAWANEEFRMPAEEPPDDEPFGDPKLQQ